MISLLFAIYRKSPFWLRNILGHATWPLRFVMLPWSRIYMGGYSMQLNFSDNAAFKYFVDRERYEELECNAFLRTIAWNPGCYVLDIGANYGPFTLAAGHLHRLGVIHQIHAFEPDVRAARALRSSIASNQLEAVAKVHEMIVGETEGVEQLFVNARSSADNRTHRVTTSPIRVQQTQAIPCRTIDGVMHDERVPFGGRFIIKMDIQGNEARALRGMQKILDQAEGIVIFFEYFPYLVQSAGIEIALLHEELLRINATKFYEITDEKLVCLNGFDDFLRSARELEKMAERHIEGPGGNYIFSRGMYTDCLAGTQPTVE
jgi:FkbM family methyltransferase